MSKIFLIGFMASGKTTIGRLLAKEMNCQFIDTDDLIIENIGMSISQFIQIRGEKAFRMLETETLKGLIAIENAIISTGGGMPCFNNNINLINKMGLSYYLCTSMDVIYPRVVEDTNRLLAFGKTKTEMNQLYKSRQKFYIQAHYRILSNRTPEKVVYRIKELIKKSI